MEKAAWVNAVIGGTMLGVEDHGILTAYLYLEYGGGSTQGFGGYTLDDWDEAKKCRVGVAAAGVFVRRVCEVVGVERWEQLKGRPMRAAVVNGRIEAIGHYIEDKWFIPSEELKA